MLGFLFSKPRIVTPSLQINWFAEWTPLVSPICIALGLGCILWWGFNQALLTGLFNIGYTLEERVFRAITSFLFVVGTLASFAAYSLWDATFWTLISILYLLGNILKGAILIILIRKIHRFISQSRSSGRTMQEQLIRITRKKARSWGFLLTGFLLITPLTIAAGAIGIALFGFSIKVVAAIGATFIGGNLIWGLTWKLRRLFVVQTPPTATTPAVVGTFFYIVGVELAAFPDYVPWPFQPLIPIAARITPFNQRIIAELLAISLLERTLLVASPVATILGAVIAIFLWQIDQPWKQNKIN